MGRAAPRPVYSRPGSRYTLPVRWRLRSSLGLLGSTRLAGACVLALGALGTYEYAKILNTVYPMRSWLFWQLGMLWGWTALFSLSCVSFGQLVLVRVIRLRNLPALEAAVHSMAIGVVSFVLAMYAAGALGWFGPVFAVALPLVLLSAGAGHGVRLARDLLADVRHAGPRGPFLFVLSATGILCVGSIYLGAMTPDALNYDSTWCHLTVAQDYARAGRIVAFPADYNKNVPQLASLIHTWGWLLPGLDQPLRWMLALHDEFGLFLWTLAGVAAGVRRLVNDQRLRGTWVAFFLFPIIFVYDHNLGGAADHVCAFFCLPILLAALRVCATFSRGSSMLLGVVSAGALLTKFQAAYVIVPLALVIGAIWARRMAEHALAKRGVVILPRVARRDLVLSPLLVAGVGALCISPHFIRQAIFHGNPFYPFLQDVFTHSTPTTPNAAFLFAQTVSDPSWCPHGTSWEKFRHACKLFVTFSFDPHYSFTRNVPAFGSLFTLLLPALLFVRDRRRLVIAAIVASGALLMWGMIYNVDRNLQIFMPLLVAITAALIVQCWRTGWLARLGLIPLLGLQIVWGGDALFYSSHGRIQSAIDLIRSGFEGHAATRLSAYRRTFLSIGDALPRDARLLLHTTHVSLGIDREVVLDWIGFQSLISYDHVHTPRELYDYYRSLGITHFLQEPGVRAAGTKQEEVLWSAFTNLYAKSMGRFDGYQLLRMPNKAPAVEASYRVATLGVSGYADGIYPIDTMTTSEYLPSQFKKYPKPATLMPPPGEIRDTLLSRVDAVLVGPSAASASVGLKRRFPLAFALPSQIEIYLVGKKR